MKASLALGICKVMDFDPSQYATAKHEAFTKEKLAGTYMIVNGELEKVVALNSAETALLIETQKGLEERDVISLETWNPEAGVYNTSIGPIYVRKLAHKYWCKSFRPVNYYIEPLGEAGLYSDLSPIYKELVGTTPTQVWISNKDKIYFLDKYVGKIDEITNSVTMINHTFTQEVLDYLRDKGVSCNLNPQ